MDGTATISLDTLDELRERQKRHDWQRTGARSSQAS